MNGVFIYRGKKNKMPFYEHLVNQSILSYSSESKWGVSSGHSWLDALWCFSFEAGLGHPSLASSWLEWVNEEFKEQPALKVATMV